MNPNPSIQAKKEWWDARMVELIDLVLYSGYRLEDLAIHFNRSAGSIASVLHRREISLVGLRYRGINPYTGETVND